jgi:hypothetical protein
VVVFGGKERHTGAKAHVVQKRVYAALKRRSSTSLHAAGLVSVLACRCESRGAI